MAVRLVAARHDRSAALPLVSLTASLETEAVPPVWEVHRERAARGRHVWRLVGLSFRVARDIDRN